jgi:hypothetical protein
MRKHLSIILVAVLLGLLIGCTRTKTPEGIAISDFEKKELMTIARRGLQGDTAEAWPEDYPHLYERDSREAFCTLFGSGVKTEIGMGKGENLAQSVLAAALEVKARAPSDATERGRIKIDIVCTKTGKGSIKSDFSKIKTESTLEGVLLVIKGKEFGLLPEEIASRGFITDKDQADASEIESSNSRLLDYLKERSGPVDIGSAEIPYSTFTTLSFVEAPNNTIKDMYRGKILVTQIDSDLLYRSSAMAAAYLESVVQKDGQFIYEYSPPLDRISSSYSVLRHAGTTYSLLEYYQFAKDRKALEKVKPALAWVKAQAHSPRPGSGQMNFKYILDEDEEANIGGAGLAVLAFCKYEEVTSDRSYHNLSVELGQHIVNQQEADGNFLCYYSYDDEEVDQRDSDYYPGEAILALLRLYQLDRNPKWLKTAEKGAMYLITERDSDIPDEDLLHDQWLMMGLNELYRLTKKKVYADHCFKIAQSIAALQWKQHKYPDWIGGFYDPPRSTPTAVRSEGLVATCGIAKTIGDTSTVYLETLKRAVAFQLNCQYTDENVIYLPMPSRALGGMKGSLEDLSIRVDYVQHSLSSFIGTYELLKEEEGRK